MSRLVDFLRVELLSLSSCKRHCRLLAAGFAVLLLTACGSTADGVVAVAPP